MKTCHSYGKSKEAFGLSGRLLRNLPPTILYASKLFKQNWGVPQFHKRLRVLIIAHHTYISFAKSPRAVFCLEGERTRRWRMSLGEPFARTTRKAPSAPMRETFIAPTLLPVCCVCGLIRDDTRFFPGLDRWVAQRTYRETHGVNPAELELTHTYCPTCFTKAQETVRQYFREIRTSP